MRVNGSQLATLHEVAEVSEGEAEAPAEDGGGGGEEGDAEADAGEEGSAEGSDSEAAASEDGGSGEVSPKQLVKQIWNSKTEVEICHEGWGLVNKNSPSF